MKSVYIAGPYSAEDQKKINENIFRAAEAAADFYKKDYAVYCPHLQTYYVDLKFNKGEIEYDDWIKADLYWLNKSDIVAFLPGWQDSYGCRIEHVVAETLGKEIIHLDAKIIYLEEGN